MSDVYRDNADATRRRLHAVRERALRLDDQLPPGAFANSSPATAERLRELRFTCTAVDRDPRLARESERLWAAYEEELRELADPQRAPFDALAEVAETIVAGHRMGRAGSGKALSERDARAMTNIVRGLDPNTRIEWRDGTLMVATPRVQTIPTSVVADRQRLRCAVTMATEVARRAPWLSVFEKVDGSATTRASGDLAFQQQFRIMDSEGASSVLAGPVAAALLKLAFVDWKPYLVLGDGIVSLRVNVAGAGGHRSKLRPELFDVALRVLSTLRQHWLPPARATPHKRGKKGYGRWPPPAARG